MKTTKKQPIEIGQHLKLFVKDAPEESAVNYVWYFKGGEKIVEAIIEDVKKEYELCPRISDFAYQHVLLSLKKWQKDVAKLNQLKENV